jgi:transposase-like protein
MDSLPENTWLSREFCCRWGGRLNIDGKYVKVKGYEKKIPFIYGIDFLTHDIPVGILAPSENEAAFDKFFSLLKACKYPLQIAISDDIAPLKTAMKRYYPKTRLQLCQTHYLENIRSNLRVRTEEKHRGFFFDLQKAFKRGLHHFKRSAMLRHLFHTKAKKYKETMFVMLDIQARYRELFAYDYKISNCPNTNNIIEAFNSHIQGRLKSIKGFQSFHSAERWLNAWMLRRRTKAFTDCGKPFKHLNGKC